MKYDFDEVISREGTNCEKLDARERLYGRGDVIRCAAGSPECDP